MEQPVIYGITILIRDKYLQRDGIIIEFINKNKLYDQINKYNYRINISILDQQKEDNIKKKKPSFQLPYLSCLPLKTQAVGATNIIDALKSLCKQITMSDQRKQNDVSALESWMQREIRESKFDNDDPEQDQKKQDEVRASKAKKLHDARTQSMNARQPNGKKIAQLEETTSVASDPRSRGNYGHESQKLYSQIKNQNSRKAPEHRSMNREDLGDLSLLSENIPDDDNEINIDDYLQNSISEVGDTM